MHIVALLLAVASGAAQRDTDRERLIVTADCQGELCYRSGEWIARWDLPLFADLGAVRPIGAIRKGMRVTALGTRVVTTRAGEAVMKRSGLFPDNAASPTAPGRITLKAGQRIRILYHKGEGVMAAMDRQGRRFGVEQGDYREITPFQATDWVRLRLPDGRTGWAWPGEAFECSSHIDDEPGRCRGVADRH